MPVPLEPGEAEAAAAAHDPLAADGDPSVWTDALLGVHVVPAPYKLEHMAGFHAGEVPTQDASSLVRVAVNPATGGYTLTADVLAESAERGGRRSSNRRNDRFHGSVLASRRRVAGLATINAKMARSGKRLRPASREESQAARTAARTAFGARLSIRGRLGAAVVADEVARAGAKVGHGTTPVPSLADRDTGPAPTESAAVVRGNIACRDGVVVHVISRILFPGDEP